MSTFDGVLEEFPHIRIDHFRKVPDRPSPLACFLSHVHSDHLQGLESFRAPFIYCSAATRELLLRIEKYPHRMNFSKGILESRKLHYKHLSKLLRPIPLNTPTELELSPRLRIRVTLLDANHCVGAVMFLIEGDDKAILYTGDIRAETWWVNSLARHPVLIPYTHGTKRLAKIYLDTTFACSSNVYREFPSKAAGIAELLRKIQTYPDHTIFYFRAWTLGYEDVWLALSVALNTRIHVDRYQLQLYRGLNGHPSNGYGVNEASFLCGFNIGNGFSLGCLSDDENCRVHSCEPGVECGVAKSDGVVYITPIVNWKGDGSEIPEVGAGGGGGDLYQVHELELPNLTALEELDKLCCTHIHDTAILSRTREALVRAFQSKNRSLSLDEYGLKEEGDVPLEDLLAVFSRGDPRNAATTDWARDPPSARKKPDTSLLLNIKFPYSRHSSYAELCELVEAFQPKDIFPCTVDPLTWSEEVSIRHLFGHLCSDTRFAHDAYMLQLLSEDETLQQKRAQRSADSLLSTQSHMALLDSQMVALDSMHESANKTSQVAGSGLKRSFCDYAESENNDANEKTTNLPSKPRHEGSCSQPPDTSVADQPAQIPSISFDNAGITPTSLVPTNHQEPQNKTPPIINEPLSIPIVTPENEGARRSRIRQAWHYLRAQGDDGVEHKDGMFHIGSLPSSWPPEEDDADFFSCHHLRAPPPFSSPDNGPIILLQTACETSPALLEESTPEMPEHPKRPAEDSAAAAQSIDYPIGRMSREKGDYCELARDSDAPLLTGSSSHAHLRTFRTPDPQACLGHAPSFTAEPPMLTSRPFDDAQEAEGEGASHEQLQRLAEESSDLDDISIADSDSDIDNNNGSVPPKSAQPLCRGNGNGREGDNAPQSVVTGSSHAQSADRGRGRASAWNRRAAYLAATMDTYEAWSAVSLITVGNNHTEEEIEL